MATRVLSLALILSSLVGYLEWGQGQSTFLAQAEWEMLALAVRSPGEVIHPFTVLPLLGQLALLWTVFQSTPSRWLTYAGIAGIGLLLGLMCFIGVIGLNPRIFVSTLPFLVLSVLTVRAHRAAHSPKSH